MSPQVRRAQKGYVAELYDTGSGGSAGSAILSTWWVGDECITCLALLDNGYYLQRRYMGLGWKPIPVYTFGTAIEITRSLFHVKPCALPFLDPLKLAEGLKSGMMVSELG